MEFEDLTYLLLRLLGIHVIYKFPRENQAGKPDGFFKFSNLAVLYDCTLSDSYEHHKHWQIENFIDRIRVNEISISAKVTERIETNADRQIWIITKGSTKLIKRHGDISVKEVNIKDLQQIYVDRLVNDLSQTTLENQLRNLGN